MSQSEYTWQLCTNLGLKALSEKNTREAEEFLATALAEAEKFKRGDPRLLESIINLANAYFHMGKVAEAEQMSRYGLNIAEALFGSTHLETARVLHNLGCYQSAQHKQSEACDNLERALEIRQKVLDGNDPEVKATLSELDKTRRRN
jgi:Tfp pilus assembly protein PilF